VGLDDHVRSLCRRERRLDSRRIADVPLTPPSAPEVAQTLAEILQATRLEHGLEAGTLMEDGERGDFTVRDIRTGRYFYVAVRV